MATDAITEPPDAANTADVLRCAIARYEAGAYTDAARLFAIIPEQSPVHATALRLRGLALVRSGAVEKGLSCLTEALTLDRDEPLAKLHYGIGLHAARRFDEAAAIFRDCLPLMPDNPAPALNLAAALLERGAADDAREAARKAVALASESAEAHYTLGLSEVASHALAEARQAFETAVKLNPQFADGWVNLGLVHYQLGDVGKAQRAMLQALEVQPSHGIAQANLAVFLWLRGEASEASTRLREVLKRDPGCIPARVKLASQLLNDREPTEALQLLAEAPPPGRLGIHWRAQKAGALIMLGRDAQARSELNGITEPPGDGEILIVWRHIVLAMRSGDASAVEPLVNRMTELASCETAALLEHRIIGHFELARFHYQRGGHERAFDHWEQAHKLLARTQPFSRQLHSDFVHASVELYNRERLLDAARSDNAGTCPIFIVGMPRSGTTLVEQILAAHPAVYGAGERPAIYETLSRLGAPPGTAESVRKTAGLDRHALSEIGQRYLQDLHALAPQAQHITDKMPGNALHLGFISTMLPGARVIYCMRDPRDTGLSIFQFRFFGYHPYAHDLADLGWYIGKHQRLMDHWRAALRLPILAVQLSEWVADFEGTLRRVLAFLGLPYAPECERFHLADRKVRTASRDQVRRPVNAGGLNRWQQYAHRLGPLIDELKSAGVLRESADFSLSRSADLF